MTHTRYAIAAYRSAVMTTPPLQAVVLLYDGLLVRIESAAVAAEKGDYERQFDETNRAVAILNGLLRSLDAARGGEVARHLEDAYRANARALMRAVTRPEGAVACRRVANGLRRLRNSWAEIGGMAPLPMPPGAGPAKSGPAKAD